METNRSSILWMINHYENNHNQYIDRKDLTIDDMATLYEYDMGMVDIYQGELLLIEAKELLYL